MRRDPGGGWFHVSHLDVGDRLGRYKLIGRIGGGAMGVRLGTPAEYAPDLPGIDVSTLEAHPDIEILPGDEPSLRSLQSAVGLIWRALLLWILLLLIVSVANWLG